MGQGRKVTAGFAYKIVNTSHRLMASHTSHKIDKAVSNHPSFADVISMQPHVC